MTGYLQKRFTSGLVFAVLIMAACTGPDRAPLDSLADRCVEGEDQACDDLFYQSESGSAFEDLGFTCGGRFERQEVTGSCVQMSETGTAEPTPTSRLKDLADSCIKGSFEDCDKLYLTSEPGSEYYLAGFTCGNRVSANLIDEFCVDYFDTGAGSPTETSTPALSTTSASTTSSAPSTTPGLTTPLTAEPFSTNVEPRAGQASGEVEHLVEVRVEQQLGFDRVIFEFAGEHIPAYKLGYNGAVIELTIEAEIGPDASGDSILIPFDSRLMDVKATEIGIQEMRWILSISGHPGFEIQGLQGPTRLIVDISQ